MWCVCVCVLCLLAMSPHAFGCQLAGVALHHGGRVNSRAHTAAGLLAPLAPPSLGRGDDRVQSQSRRVMLLRLSSPAPGELLVDFRKASPIQAQAKVPNTWRTKARNVWRGAGLA